MSYHAVPQDEMPFAGEIESALRTYSFESLYNMRDALRARLRVAEPKTATLLDSITACAPGQDGAAFTAALAVIEGKAARGRLKMLRTLCLYIRARELRAAPHASVLRPTIPPPKADQPSLFSTTNPEPKTQQT